MLPPALIYQGVHWGSYLLAAVVVFAQAGCGSGESKPATGPARGAPSSAVADEMISPTAVVAMVQASAAVDHAGTTAAWVDRQLHQMTGQVMFPSWGAERRGASKFEVRFVFTLIDNANRIVKRGYAWTVDVPLSLVGPPREIAPEYSPSSDRAGNADQDRHRVTREQTSLE